MKQVPSSEVELLGWSSSCPFYYFVLSDSWLPRSQSSQLRPILNQLIPNVMPYLS